MRNLLILLLLSSCLNAKKVNKYLDKNELFTAKNCADRFPIVSDTVITLDYISDTMTIENIRWLKQDTIRTKLPCNCKDKIILKTVTITKENTASYKFYKESKSKDSIFYNKSIADLNSKIIIREDRVKQLKHRNMYLWLIILILSLIIVRKPILRLIGTSF